MGSLKPMCDRFENKRFGPLDVDSTIAGSCMCVRGEPSGERVSELGKLDKW